MPGIALVSGFGMINYDRGLCTGAAILGRRDHDRAAAQAHAAQSDPAPCGSRRCRRRAQPRALRLTAAAAEGRFELQTCHDCGRCNIRRASLRVNCLSPVSNGSAVDGAAT